MNKLKAGYKFTANEIAARIEAWAAGQSKIDALQLAGNDEMRQAWAVDPNFRGVTTSQIELQRFVREEWPALECAVAETGLEWRHIHSLRHVIEADTEDDNPTIVAQWLKLMGLEAIRPQMPGDKGEDGA